MVLITISSLFFIFNFVSVLTENTPIEALEALAKQWAPKIFLHQDETYFPLSIEKFLENMQCSKLNSPPITAEELPMGPSSYPYYLSTKADVEMLIHDQSSFLHGLNPASHNKVPMYAAIELCSSTNDHFIVTYYAFFGFKEGHFSSHVGDFQIITMEIKNQSPQRLVLSVHNTTVQYKFDGRDYFVLVEAEKKGMVQVQNAPSQIALLDGHPVLFAAKNSHALYGLPGTYNYHVTKLPTATDETAYGIPWDTWKSLDVMFTNKRASDWFYYGGKWGNPKSKCRGALKNLGVEEICAYSDGPEGPYKREWDIKCNK